MISAQRRKDGAATNITGTQGGLPVVLERHGKTCTTFARRRPRMACGNAGMRPGAFTTRNNPCHACIHAPEAAQRLPFSSYAQRIEERRPAFGDMKPAPSIHSHLPEKEACLTLQTEQPTTRNAVRGSESTFGSSGRSVRRKRKANAIATSAILQ